MFSSVLLFLYWELLPLKHSLTKISDLYSPEKFINACLEEMGVITIQDDTMKVLIEFASQEHNQPITASINDRQRIAETLQMIASTKEFQRS